MPVPIHFFRMLKRKYNQSALLARFIGKASGKPVFYNTLARVRATKSQGHMGEKERRANVKGAFRAKPRPELAGADVLLIDDVFTTGATVSECAAVLKKAGAARVYVLAFARA
jgi:ComF family protein